MDYAVPVILFLLGFSAFLLASKGLRWSLRGRRSVRIPAEDGAVRLGPVGKRSATPVGLHRLDEREGLPATGAPAKEPPRGAPEGTARRGGSRRRRRK